MWKIRAIYYHKRGQKTWQTNKMFSNECVTFVELAFAYNGKQKIKRTDKNIQKLTYEMRSLFSPEYSKG